MPLVTTRPQDPLDESERCTTKIRHYRTNYGNMKSRPRKSRAVPRHLATISPPPVVRYHFCFDSPVEGTSDKMKDLSIHPPEWYHIHNMNSEA